MEYGVEFGGLAVGCKVDHILGIWRNRISGASSELDANRFLGLLLFDQPKLVVFDGDACLVMKKITSV